MLLLGLHVAYSAELLLLEVVRNARELVGRLLDPVERDHVLKCYELPRTDTGSVLSGPGPHV